MNIARVSALMLLLFAIAATPVLAQDERVATITLGRDPEPPFCISNPGGTADIFWEIEHYTTPQYVLYELEDPTRTIVIEQETYPGDTGIAVNRSWSVPDAMPDGKYWIRVEYWSYEAGNEANAEVAFYVCTGMGNLCAFKHKDADCNGTLDPDDPPIAGWWICFTDAAGDTYCSYTDQAGTVCWNGVPFGSYHVFEHPVEGWSPVGADAYDIVLDEEPVALQFLNVKYDECFGACCLNDGTCGEITEHACAGEGGTFYGLGSACADVVCPQPEACCMADGSCAVMPPEQCTAAGGTPQGLGTDCDPNPCPPPVPTERTTWGRVKATYR